MTVPGAGSVSRDAALPEPAGGSELARAAESRTAEPDPATHDAGNADDPRLAAFAHASEAEMARILDFYAVAWQYEPETFPILWNLDGDVIESFAPDFYLPELDIYLEMTTLRQRLVRKKNRKLRRLRELYPDVRIKLFYARDFRALMLKYGRLAVVDGLSGTLGQVPSHRLAAIDASSTPIAAPIALGTEDAAAGRRAAERPVDTDAPAAAAGRATDAATDAATHAAATETNAAAIAAAESDAAGDRSEEAPAPPRPAHRSRSARRRRAAAARRSESAIADLAVAGHSAFLDGAATHAAASADR